MGPVGHIGITIPVAHALKLSLPVSAFCSLLPDLVDKSLLALGIAPCGRYVGHTLIFVFLVAIIVSFRNKRYGLSALLGGLGHLILDSRGFVPWFYPFVSYDFSEFKYNYGWSERLQGYLSFSGIVEELICIASIGLVVFLCTKFFSWFKKRAL